MALSIKIRNLSVAYDLGKQSEVWALRNINLEIFKGEYVVFFGPSGCGKSTLLFSLAGLQTPTSGKIIIGNKDISDMSDKELIKHRRLTVGLVFQNFNLIPTLNVLDNVLLPTILGGSITSESIERANRILKSFGISDLVNRYPSELSGGQQQRTAIARAMIYDPPILLADEPTGNLDSVSAKAVMDTLYDFNKNQDKVIILVSHDPLWLDYAHRIFYMKDGEIVREKINRKRSQISLASPRKSETVEIREKKIPTNLRSLIYYLLTSFDEPVISRLERTIKKRIEDKISKDELEEILDRPFEEGGVGLYKQTAESLAAKIERVLVEIESATKLKKLYKGGEEEEEEKGLREIRLFLLDGWHGHFTKIDQVERLDMTIKRRLKGELDREEFQRILDLPFSSGGVGLDKRTAKNFTKKMEIVVRNIHY